jgi:hypothetical protein
LGTNSDRPATKPDLLIRYPPEENGFAPGSNTAAYAVVYVRPETNTVLYERAIVAGIRDRGDSVIYTANLSGALFRQDGILRDHYVTQLRFAEDPRGELNKYPEIGLRLERRFGAPIGKLPLVGAFEATTRTAMTEEELFESFVPQPDFLACWGQQFKRIGDAVVVNPSLPAVVKRYTPGANVFVVVVRSSDGSPGFFASLNRAIYDEVSSRSETPLVDGARLGAVSWSERVRRTYHISRSHLMALFDMSDFVYLSDSRRLAVTETPLGRSLLAEGILTAEKLQDIKRDPLVRRRGGGGESLKYLPLAGEGRSLAWTRELLRQL